MEPCQLLTHLGLEIDTVTGCFKLGDTRRQKIARLSRELGVLASPQARWVPAKKLAQFIGTAQSAMLAVPPARFYLRALHDVLAQRDGWNGQTRLTKAALRDMRW